MTAAIIDPGPFVKVKPGVVKSLATGTVYGKPRKEWTH